MAKSKKRLTENNQKKTKNQSPLFLVLFSVLTPTTLYSATYTLKRMFVAE